MSQNVSMGAVLADIGMPPDVCQRFAHIILPFAPMPHQLAGIQLALNWNRSGVFFEPRTGKTLVLQILAIYYAYYGIGTIQLMPPALFRQFSHDYQEIAGHGMRIHTLSEGPARRAKLLETWEHEAESRPHIVLLSRDIFKSVWPSLYLQGYRHLHFDESHLGLQDPDSGTAKAVRAFANQNVANRLVLSTGTPIPNKVANAFATANLLRSDVYPTVASFNNAHCLYRTVYVPGKFGTPRPIKVIDSYTHLDKLSEVIYSRSVHAAKREVLSLEAPNIQIIECDLKPRHRALYAKVLKDRMLEFSDQVIDARTAQKLRQVALQLITSPSDFADNYHDTDNSVYETLSALVDSVNPEKEKVVIFANYIRSVETISKLFGRLNPAIVYGPNGPRSNAQEVERFRKQPSCRLLVANPESGGVGFKLGDVSTTVIFAEPVSTPGQFDQCLSRVMLLGQTEPVVCYIIKVNNTLSPAAINLMLSKAVSVNEVIRSQKTLFDELLGHDTHTKASK